MLFQDIFSADSELSTLKLQPIIRNCSQFLEDAGSFPLIRNFSAAYPPIHRVKVRLQKRREEISEPYDMAFGGEFTNLRERAVFARSTYEAATTGQEPYYIFPIDGYKFLYSKEVVNSSIAYKSVINLLTETEGDKAEVTKILSDILKYTYSTTHLQEGMQAGAEIVIYNIPHFYVVKASAIKGYDKLLSAVTRAI